MNAATERTRISAARTIAAVLALGGLGIGVLLVYLRMASPNSWMMIGGSLIVLFWLLRALNLGQRSVWLSMWIVSLLWHLFFIIAGIAGVTLALSVFGIPYGWPLLLWVVLAFALSGAGFASDLETAR
jgi:hypothetical protein